MNSDIKTKSTGDIIADLHDDTEALEYSFLKENREEVILILLDIRDKILYLLKERLKVSKEEESEIFSKLLMKR